MGAAEEILGEYREPRHERGLPVASPSAASFDSADLPLLAADDGRCGARR